jgi:hypothetical protein
MSVVTLNKELIVVQDIETGIGQVDQSRGIGDRINASNLSYDGFTTIKDQVELRAISTNVLELNNTEAYTPYEDYNPATKKYVDDNIGGPGGGITVDPTPVEGSINAVSSGGTYDALLLKADKTYVDGLEHGKQDTLVNTVNIKSINGDTLLGSGDLVVAISYDSPAFTGVPTAPTAPIGDNSAQIATTAFVLANGGSGGGGVTDHGALTGLTNDDHKQYYNQARADSRYVTLNSKGVANGVVPLNASNTIDSAYLPWTGLSYQGGWDASTGTLPSSPSDGDLYSITVAGTLLVVPPGSSTGVPESTLVKVGELITYSANATYWYLMNANTAVNDARYVQLSGSIMTGFLEVPANASGNQVPRRSEIDTALALKAPLDSPTLTGIPVAPTAVAGSNTTQIATTKFVTDADNLKAPLASPALTGTPTAPTAGAGTNTTQLATTAFVLANSIQATEYSTSTVGGTVKMRLDGTTLYITNDGTDA